MAKILTGWVMAVALASAGIAVQMSAAEAQMADSSPTGVWSCQSVYGGPFTGRSCSSWPWLKLNTDRSYTWGSEQGSWEFRDGVLRLSGRTGTGRLDADGKLVVEYTAKGTRYRQVLIRRQ